ncbi:MAG TPA: hypothetical protein VK897_22600 [Anaerolineales bacterium]|nr:hypothetical protein [Anaerolineales bacterium]
MTGTARLVFHVIPYSAFETKPQINLKTLEEDIWSLSLIYSSISSYRYNLDGLIAYNNKDNNSTGAYTQLYRNGIIESVSTTVFNSAEGNPYIPSIVFEQELIEALKTYISTHQKLLISPPSVLTLSLVGVRGYKLAVSQRLDAWHNHIHVIDRDSLLLPETIIEDYAIDPAAILRPIFDAVWNSAGWPKSYGYDESGEWGKGSNFHR